MSTEQICNEVSSILAENYPEIHQERVTADIIGLGGIRPSDELYFAAVNFELMDEENGYVEFNAPDPNGPQMNQTDRNELMEDSNPQVLARRIAALYSDCLGRRKAKP